MRPAVGPSGPVRRPRAVRRTWIADGAVVLVLLGVSLGANRHHVGPRTPGLAVLSAGLLAPLVFRRRAPLTVFAVIAAFALAQWIWGRAMFADVALLWAFYAVAAHSTLRRTIAAGAVLELGVILAVAKYGGPHNNDPLGWFFLSGLVTAAGVLGANLKIRRAYLAAVEQRAAQLEFERDQQSQLAVAAERTRIAREMHDVIAHNLTVMIALTDGAALTVERDPQRAGAAIQQASAAGRSALHEMRRVLGVLRDDTESPAMAPAPAIGDLDALLQGVRRTGLDVRFETHGQLDDLGTGLELTIYRLVQEAVTNTVKHARTPSLIVVSIGRAADVVTVTIIDDGGTVEHALGPVVGPVVGHGLTGMRERVAVHAGQVEVGPTATGWRVTARLPLTPANHPAPALLPAAGPR